MKLRLAAGYVALLAVCLAVSVVAGWTEFGAMFDNDVYDVLFRLQPPPEGVPSSIILGIDERSLSRGGGVAGIRAILADALERIAGAGPRAVVVDVILADNPAQPENARLAAAFARTKNLVLAADLISDGWELPLPDLAAHAAGIGHVHSDPDYFDNVLRHMPLEKIAHGRRMWALALEAHRVANRVSIGEEPGALTIGGVRLETARESARAMRIRYLGPRAIPEVTVHEILTNPAALERVRGRVVFAGITAQSAARDRHMTPFSFGQTMPGVEVHANAYETLARGQHFSEARNLTVIAAAALLCALAGVVFWRFTGALGYGLGGAVLVLAHAAPWAAFRAGVVFPYTAPFLAAWLSTAAAASYQHFVVRRRLGQSEIEKERYQQAIHFVAHEMRTPLQAIQGSSELMGRYKLPEDKRSELAKTINSESRRLAKMIQTFLDVERLTEGQMELKREDFALAPMVDLCIERALPLAERKRIAIRRENLDEAMLSGDRELMEYAVYNLLTNAIKYSPAETQVTVGSRWDRGAIRLDVRDQGIGMDEKELRNIFRKFYRTRKAEQSGEAGTGIGLSIVDQIVTHHGGSIEVASQPGKGSSFTIVVPAVAPHPHA